MSAPLPKVVVNAMPSFAQPLLQGQIEALPWDVALLGTVEPVDGLFIYGHPTVDGPLLDRLPGLRIISNHGVGVDHIDLRAAAERGIRVGNTPGVLDGAVADLAFALMLAAARRLVEADRYARGPEFLRFDPSFMLGRDVCGSTLGIIGLGSIGLQIAQRARGFDMRVVYHNRRQRSLAVEQAAEATYLSLDELLMPSRLRGAYRSPDGRNTRVDRPTRNWFDQADRNAHQRIPRTWSKPTLDRGSGLKLITPQRSTYPTPNPCRAAIRCWRWKISPSCRTWVAPRRKLANAWRNWPWRTCSWACAASPCGAKSKEGADKLEMQTAARSLAARWARLKNATTAFFNRLLADSMTKANTHAMLQKS